MVVQGIGKANLKLTSALFQILVSLLVAVVTALLTVWLSLRRFYREKWWEAKMRAYTDLIHALHDMKRDLEISIQSEMRGQDTDTDYHKKWEEKHRAAWDEIRKDIDIGEFLFSTGSVEILEELVRDTTGPHDDYFSYLEMTRAGVDKCLPAIKKTAKADLELPTIGRGFRIWSPK